MNKNVHKTEYQVRKMLQKKSMKQIVREKLLADPITIRDKENFKARWGHYP